MKEPQRKHHRQRAHANPFSDHDIAYPLNPEAYGKSPEMVDIGCGYGGLLFKLSEMYPEKTSLGMEIRKKIVEYVELKIQYRRAEHKDCHNVSVVRTNSMKFLPNYLGKDTVEKMFILFPDPHFKKKKHKARIVSPAMLDIYQYVLAARGLLYLSTDVEELFEYMVETVEKHPLFERVSREEEEGDPLWDAIIRTTEESKKADMKQSNKYRAIFRNRS
ncbi:tRNA (guanine-N7-)-methyltransferase [Nematocida sp. AWRm77]|nr:tRNA (guanine-N7-)-methyltransferase [Nematocida sp. AWRm77]